MISGSDLIPAVVEQLNEYQYKSRIVPITRLGDLQEAFEVHHKQGLLDQDLFETYLSSFAFAPPDELRDAQSMIIVAVPQPQGSVTFDWHGESIELIVPPTYLHGSDTDQRVGTLLAGLLEPAGYRLERAVLPEKLLAVCSGLAAYGRNNVSYVSGMGSFHRLVPFYSDTPCPEDGWQEPAMVDRCQTCSACVRHCPTGAITTERFLLRAERCITFRNEKPGDVPFPAWLDPAWHNCLVGCLHCQKICPENKAVRDWVEEGPRFSQQETDLLLQGVPLDQLPAETAAKLEQSDMVGMLDCIPRNLGALLQTQKAH
jgi:epoxyqueuosine reductase